MKDPASYAAPPRAGARAAVRPLFWFAALAIAATTLSRLGLALWQWERVSAAGRPYVLFLQGLRFDLVAVGALLLPPSLLLPPLLLVRRAARPAGFVLAAYLAAAFAGIVFLELATPAFLEEYDARPNFLFVEYLVYPREVLATLWGAYPLRLVGTAVAVPLVALGTFRLLRRAAPVEAPLRPGAAALLLVALPLLDVAAIRSTLAHRPVNPSTACYSGDAMVNTLPLPSIYSLAYAVYELERNEAEDEVAYGSLPYEEVLDVVRAESGLPPAAFSDPAIPTLHVQHVAQRARPKNLVIVLEESLGAEFVGAMGGLPLTPELDALLDQGLALDRLYATGTRSVRGIEAVVTGFLPTPVRSVVKQPRAQRNFFTLAELLRREGYATSFVYGGEAHFDNMARFFTGNGFETVLDRSDFGEVAFEGSWGASDQDLFREAHEHFLEQGDRPFFSLVFTSSNHSPFEYPEGVIEPYDEPAATRDNAVKYADHALGEFFDRARSAPYWEDTVFLVVADHNSRVYGPALVPVEHFHVPAVFLGADIAPEHVDTLASQVDLVPTALALIGLEAAHPCLGRDLTDPAVRARPGRAILQFHDANLYLTDAHAVLHRPHQPAAHLRWDGDELQPQARDEALERVALAHALWPQMSYPLGDYRLPAQASAE